MERYYIKRNKRSRVNWIDKGKARVNSERVCKKSSENEYYLLEIYLREAFNTDENSGAFFPFNRKLDAEYQVYVSDGTHSHRYTNYADTISHRPVWNRMFQFVYNEIPNGSVYLEIEECEVLTEHVSSEREHAVVGRTRVEMPGEDRPDAVSKHTQDLVRIVRGEKKVSGCIRFDLRLSKRTWHRDY